MIHRAQEHARRFVANQPQPEEIACDLSAGLDSRVTWSLLLSVVDDPSLILAKISGETYNREVQTACRLAKMYGTRFSSSVESAPSPDDFLTRCDLLAFFVNGGTPGKRAMKYPTGFVQDPKAYACGAGGEIFRGYYYPYPQLPKLRPPISSSIEAYKILEKRMRLERFPWRDPALAEAVRARLNSTIDELTMFSTNGYDILDLYYLYERFAVWGAAQARQTWKDHRWSPFISPKMVRMAFRMPAPIATETIIHYECLRRFAPKAYWVRVNGELLVLEGGGKGKAFLRKLDGKCQGGFRRLPSVVSWGSDTKKNQDMDHLVHDFLAGPLMEVVRDMLMSNDSFAQRIFGKNGTDQLLREHATRTKNHTEELGFLVAMERWRMMVDGVTRDAVTTV